MESALNARAMGCARKKQFSTIWCDYDEVTSFCVCFFFHVAFADFMLEKSVSLLVHRLYRNMAFSLSISFSVSLSRSVSLLFFLFSASQEFKRKPWCILSAQWFDHNEKLQYVLIHKQVGCHGEPVLLFI